MNPSFISSATMKIVANAAPDWTRWRVRVEGNVTLFEFSAEHTITGVVYACSYGMVDREEDERILTGVVGLKHDVTIETLAQATGR